MEEVRHRMVKAGKRMLAVLLCVVVLAGAVSGCGSNETSGGNIPDGQAESSEESSGSGQTPN